MTTSFLDINKEIAKLQAQADKLKAKEIGGVIKRIREAIQVYGLTAEDLGLARGVGRPAATAERVKPVRRGRKAAARGGSSVVYTNGDKEWSGRGRRPGWILEGLAAGKSLDDFLKR